MFKQVNKKISAQVSRLRGEMATPFERLVGHLELFLGDHGFFRSLYLNRHNVSDELERAAQPGPRQIRQMGRRGIRTIINLRGPRDCAGYLLEKEACEKAGIRLVDFQVRSRELPDKKTLRAAERLFQEIEYPALLHCKSGADRAGFMSALYLLVHKQRPVEEASRQLHGRFGHIREGATGVLDRFFDAFAAHQAATGESFHQWVATAYNPKALRQDFKASWWGTLLVDRLLRRE